jgi:hypothetical protein
VEENTRDTHGEKSAAPVPGAFAAGDVVQAPGLNGSKGVVVAKIEATGQYEICFIGDSVMRIPLDAAALRKFDPEQQVASAPAAVPAAPIEMSGTTPSRTKRGRPSTTTATPATQAAEDAQTPAGTKRQRQEPATLVASAGKDSITPDRQEAPSVKPLQTKRSAPAKTAPAKTIAAVDPSLPPDDSLAACLAQARSLGFQKAFETLSARVDVKVSGISPKAMVEALKVSEGLVNPAKIALLRQ